ncbi:MAG: hypothetical protein AAFN77_09915 [Planctomycetota bacterium]
MSFSIDNKYANELRQKMQVFRELAESNKASSTRAMKNAKKLETHR